LFNPGGDVNCLEGVHLGLLRVELDSDYIVRFAVMCQPRF